MNHKFPNIVPRLLLDTKLVGLSLPKCHPLAELFLSFGLKLEQWTNYRELTAEEASSQFLPPLCVGGIEGGIQEYSQGEPNMFLLH